MSLYERAAKGIGRNNANQPTPNYSPVAVRRNANSTPPAPAAAGESRDTSDGNRGHKGRYQDISSTHSGGSRDSYASTRATGESRGTYVPPTRAAAGESRDAPDGNRGHEGSYQEGSSAKEEPGSIEWELKHRREQAAKAQTLAATAKQRLEKKSQQVLKLQQQVQMLIREGQDIKQASGYAPGGFRA